MTNILLNITQENGYATKITNVSEMNLIISGIPVDDMGKVLHISEISPKNFGVFEGKMDLTKYYFSFEELL